MIVHGINIVFIKLSDVLELFFFPLFPHYPNSDYFKAFFTKRQRGFFSGSHLRLCSAPKMSRAV